MIALSTSQKRLITGAVQGLILYLLYRALDKDLWPSTDGHVFAPLLLLASIIPPLLIVSFGNMRPKSLTAWMLVVAALLVMLGCYDIVRRGAHLYGNWEKHAGVLPSFTLCFFTVIGLFIGQSLVMAADSENRRIASYPCYFDVSWKLALQFILASIFIGLFWAVLWMGVELFTLIQIDFFEKLIRHDWFWIPASTLASAYALHLTDVRVNLVRGIRTLKLTLLAWLLPLMALFVAGFLGSVPFKGFGLLWNTHHTSQILLGAACWLILLINASYQDGAPEHNPTKILQYSAGLAALLLLPLIAIASYALSLRVDEYGWTVNLIEVAACLAIAVFYAIGYLGAALMPGLWLKRLEATNIFTCFVILIVLVCLFTPVADPARLSVADQLSRLKSGKTPADKFDYAYLKKNGESYGDSALRQLIVEATGPNAETIKTRAEAALAMSTDNPASVTPPQPAQFTLNVKVYPEGSSLPDSFTHQDWTAYQSQSWALPQCLFNSNAKCEAFIFDPQAILVINASSYGNATLFAPMGVGWTPTGHFTRTNCKGVHEALVAGSAKLTTTTVPQLQVNGIDIPLAQNDRCP